MFGAHLRLQAGVVGIALLCAAVVEGAVISHPPMRPLPVASQRPKAAGPAKFVDCARGNDANDGSEAAPWRTIGRAVRALLPGDTLYLRGGVYYETVTVNASGTAEAPVTIRAFPGELAVVDAGFREFVEDPATAWEPAPGGHVDEYRSTRTYLLGGGFWHYADPRFVTYAPAVDGPNDFHLQNGSPAIDAGVSLPSEWPDPLRVADTGRPDIGALPQGAGPFRAGR